MSVQQPPARLARGSCLPCKLSKRRCSKRLPQCDLCVRKEIDCSYPGRRERRVPYPAPSGWTPDTPSPGSDRHLHDRAPSYSYPSPSAGPAECSNAAIYFIEPRVFHAARLELPRRELPVPRDVASVLGDTSSVRNIASEFFRRIHAWMPIVSKREFFAHLLNPLAGRRTELCLLALCMRLSCPEIGGRTQDGREWDDIYRTAKRYHFEVESTGLLSISVLQSAILIAIHEIGQAVYPAAFLTIGACARYGTALGLDKIGSSPMGDQGEKLSWDQIEERRRVWWAVLMLDR